MAALVLGFCFLPADESEQSTIFRHVPMHLVIVHLTWILFGHLKGAWVVR